MMLAGFFSIFCSISQLYLSQLEFILSAGLFHGAMNIAPGSAVLITLQLKKTGVAVDSTIENS